MEDLHALLGVPPGADPGEITAAFRALAKQVHPDAAGGAPDATARMAELNAAYAALRSGPVRRRARRGARAPGRPAAGAWLAPQTRAVLGFELVEALERDENVDLVTPASTWASPRTLLALTDRRLLWLHDDAVLGRVRSVRLCDVIAADVRLSWPRRRSATLRVRERYGRRHAFSGLRPSVAGGIARALAAHAPS